MLGFAALVVLLGAPAGAQMMSGSSTSGMGSMQYYVGSWDCMAGPAGKPPSKATATFAMDTGLLRQTVVVPAQGKMKTAYSIVIVTSWDAKNHRYVQTGLGNDSGWWVDYAKPFMGKTEEWVDHNNSTGKLGKSETIRVSNDKFTFTGYETMTGTKPNFVGTCTRSASSM